MLSRASGLDTCQHQDFLPDAVKSAKVGWKRTPVKWSGPNSPATSRAQSSFNLNNHPNTLVALYNHNTHFLELKEYQPDRSTGPLNKIFVQITWHYKNRPAKSQVYMFQEAHHCGIHLPTGVGAQSFSMEAIYSDHLLY